MKRNHAIRIVSVLLAILANECQANFDGCDNFTGNSIDPTRWVMTVISGVGLLTETNQRLEYATSGTPTARDSAALTWIPNSGSYTQNWELKVDMNIGALSFTNSSQSVALQLQVFPGSDMSNHLFAVDFQHNTNGGLFECKVRDNHATTLSVTKNTTSTNVAMRITFDASTQLLSAFYDEDGP